MNEVIIRIIDNDNNVLGDLDLTDFNDFPLALTKGIVNLDNLQARTGTYSKTFKIPITKNNADLLSNVDDINSRKDFRDALNRKPCVIIVNNNQLDKGFIQVNKVFEKESFELIFFGNNIDWVKSASELNLDDIDYRNNTQTYDSTNIDLVNASDSDTYDHCYPYVGRGGNSQTYNTLVEDYYPVFYTRSIIERGLNQLGWNVSSSFLIDSVIKRMVCDFSLKFLISDEAVENTRVRASKISADKTITYLDAWRIEFGDDSTAPNKDTGSNYDNTTFQYTAPETGRYDFNITVTTRGTISTSNFTDPTQETDFFICEGGTTTTLGSIVYQTTLDTSRITNLPNTDTVTVTNLQLESGKTYSFYFRGTGTNNGQVLDATTFINFTIELDSSTEPTYFNVQRRADLSDGQQYDLKDVAPDDISLLDVINDFTRMHNIYYWTDVKSKTIYFEPRDQFFKPITEAINWTDKIDYSKPYEVDYVSSYKRNIQFSYRDLNNDEWLKGWQDVNKRTYGRYKHVLPDRFAEGTTDITLSTFCASYTNLQAEATPAFNGSIAQDNIPVTIRIWDDYVNNSPNTRTEDYNPKIYIFNNGTQQSVGGTSKFIQQFGLPQSTIPYGIFQSYANVTADKNLSFTGDDGLFATHYSNMMKNIEDGGRLISYVKLDETDFENLDFRKLIRIDYPADVQGYYFVELIDDFKPLDDNTTKVSLFKVENLGSVPIDDSQQGNNSSDDDASNTTPDLQPIYIEDNGQLIEVGIIDPITGLQLVYL